MQPCERHFGHSKFVLLGSPISYKGVSGEEKDVQKLKENLKTAQVAETDQENALTCSIVGLSYEYIYRARGERTLMSKSLSPLQTFIVEDDSIEHEKLFGVYYYYKEDDTKDRNKSILYITLVTDKEIRQYNSKDEDNNVVKNCTIGTYSNYRV